MSIELGYEADTRRGRRAAASAARTGQPTMMRPRQFSDASGIPLRTLYREIAEGRIPHVRVGERGLYIPASYLSELAAMAAGAVAA